MRLCSKTDEYYDDIGFQYPNNENASQAICCGIICAKSLAIIFNFLFIVSFQFKNKSMNNNLKFYLLNFKLTGILLILIGSWTINSKLDYVNLLSSSLYQASTYILIIAGIIIAITGYKIKIKSTLFITI